MPDSNDVSAFVATELARIHDERVRAKLREILVLPYSVRRAWDYGQPGQTYECWTVAEHRDSNTAIAYCDQGFGPNQPWGLVAMGGDYTGIGMNSGWFGTLEEAFRDSFAWDEAD